MGVGGGGAYQIKVCPRGHFFLCLISVRTSPLGVFFCDTPEMVVKSAVEKLGLGSQIGSFIMGP